mmetsp:Transcript_31953/g.48180  ORF Transcript_31953/g.48180 Transcript_31953/m.48180 type:complete len:237 (-) Transcript_31953:115-825(-)
MTITSPESCTSAEAPLERWHAALKSCPVVAILRGVTPAEVLEVGQELTKAGIKILEVPLNSPNAKESIRTLVGAALGDDVVIGAGTVLSVEDVEAVAATGASLVVSPNVDEAVVRKTKALGMISLPGVATPSEAFSALRWGADALKAFPGEQIPPKIIKAWKAVLPKTVCLMPVGGVTLANMQDYWDVGASGFGVGTSLYAPGDTPEEVAKKARDFVQHMEAVTRTQGTKRPLPGA